MVAQLIRRRPGAVVAQGATQWTLGHEIGHVLGLFHVNNNNRLMTGNGTGNITNPPPDLIASEINTMVGSALTVNDKGECHGVTMKQVLALLDVDEPVYAEAAGLGAGALVHVEALIEGPDPMLASKAAFLAGMIAAATRRCRY
jgi:hypothetical protein